MRPVLFVIFSLGLVLSGCRATSSVVWRDGRYPDLIAAVEKTGDRSIALTRRAGPTQEDIVRYVLTRDPEQGLVLEIVHPPQAFFKLGPTANRDDAVEVTPRIVIRDRNLDGAPDDARMDFGGLQSPGEKVFLPVDGGDPRSGFYSQWVDGIGFFLDYLQDGTGGAFPSGNAAMPARQALPD